MRLTKENLYEVQMALSEGYGLGSYAAFDGTGLVIVYPEALKIVPWDSIIGKDIVDER